jgi:hypothetical protein
MRVPLVVSLVFSLFASTTSLAQSSFKSDRLPPGIIEISPDLFLLVHRYGRLENLLDVKLETLRRANDFAASRGGVVVPVLLDSGPLTIRAYQYQFRVMSREQALALKPVLSESLITVHNSGNCAPDGNVIAALSSLNQREQQTLKLVALPPLLMPGIGSVLGGPDNESSPPAFCLPGSMLARHAAHARDAARCAHPTHRVPAVSGAGPTIRR